MPVDVDVSFDRVIEELKRSGEDAVTVDICNFNPWLFNYSSKRERQEEFADILKKTRRKHLHILLDFPNGHEFFQLLTEALNQNTSIKELSLRVNPERDKEVLVLAKFLEINTKLNHLALTCRTCTLDQIKTLAQAFNKNTSLETLKLSYLGHEGAEILAQTFSKNTSLTSLSFDHTHFSNHAIEALASSLEENTSLETFEIIGKPISYAGALALTRALRRNTFLKTLKLSDTGINQKRLQLLCHPTKLREMLRAEYTLVLYAIGFAKKACARNIPLEIIQMIFLDLAKKLKIQRTPQEINRMIALVMANIRSMNQPGGVKDLSTQWKNIRDGKNVFLFPPRSSFFSIPLPPAHQPPPIPEQAQVIDDGEQKDKAQSPSCVLQ